MMKDNKQQHQTHVQTIVTHNPGYENSICGTLESLWPVAVVTSSVKDDEKEG
jgi:hypothetical protein